MYNVCKWCLLGDDESCVSLVGQHEWDGAVESHLVVQLVLKHVQIVQAVGVPVTGMDGERGRESSGRGERGRLTWWS